MNFDKYAEMIDKVPYTDTLKYKPAIMWLHPERLPLGVSSIGDTTSKLIKIPDKALNKYGKKVSVIAISPSAFAGKAHIEDIVLPHSIRRIPAGAFAGCTGLKRISIPRDIRIIKEETFSGCRQLEDVYYEGTMDEWNQLNIVHQKHEIEFGALIPGTPVQEVRAERLLYIPGNEALFTANIHFNCQYKEQHGASSFEIRLGGDDITGLFRVM